MSYHRTGSAIIKDEKGKEYHYELEAWGSHLVLKDKESEYSFLEDKKPILKDKLCEEIAAIKETLKEKIRVLKTFDN